MTQLQFIEIYSDIGAGKHGTTQGVAELSKHCEAVYPNAYVHKIDIHKTSETPSYPKAKYIEQLTPFFETTLVPQMRQVLTDCEQMGRFPVVISGDHSNAIGGLAAFLEHHKDKRVGVIWIDAHADLHTVFTTPSGNMHGTPVATALRLDNTECQAHEVSSEVANFWQRLKALAPNSHGVHTEDVYFLGVRSFESPEAYLIEKYNLFAYSSIDHRHAGLQRVLDKMVARLEAVEAVYVSFDVDSLDGVLIPATGTPEPEGYSADELRQILKTCLRLPQTKLFEMTEFNPTLDDDKDKQRLIFELLDDALLFLAER